MWYFSLKVKWYIYMKPLSLYCNLFQCTPIRIFFSWSNRKPQTHCSHAICKIITSLGEFKFKYLLITNFTACTPERAGVTLSPMWTIKQRSNDWEFQPVSPPSRLISDNYNAWISHTVFTCMALFHIFSLNTNGVHPIFIFSTPSENYQHVSFLWKFYCTCIQLIH